MIPFIQSFNQSSTLATWKRMLDGNDLNSLGAFAYVTDSGVAQINTYLATNFSASRSSRWIFGIDYGRSHPTAIRKLASIGRHHDIRIHDGAFVVQSQGFIPRISYHLKTALTLDSSGFPCKQIIGSGNLSASGLSSGIEAGCMIDYTDIDRSQGEIMIATVEEIWNKAVPYEDVISEYERRYIPTSRPVVNKGLPTNMRTTKIFWIDVGYVTKNRGAEKPGNQFDLPRGFHVHLGLSEVLNPTLNSTLGDISIRTPTGKIVQRPMRFGNNSMEKLTLPVPEEHGYQSYDGKIITFELNGDIVAVEAFEHDDFFRAYGGYIESYSEMQSGRRFGTILLPQQI